MKKWMKRSLIIIYYKFPLHLIRKSSRKRKLLKQLRQTKEKTKVIRSEERRVGKEHRYTRSKRDWSSDVCSSDLKIEPEKLAGKSGHLDIEISTEENEKVDETFFDYYLLQISITLDPQKFTQTQAPKATQANEGKDESY